MTSGAAQRLALCGAGRRLDEPAEEFFCFSRVPRAPLITASIFTAFHC